MIVLSLSGQHHACKLRLIGTVCALGMCSLHSRWLPGTASADGPVGLCLAVRYWDGGRGTGHQEAATTPSASLSLERRTFVTAHTLSFLRDGAVCSFKREGSRQGSTTLEEESKGHNVVAAFSCIGVGYES